MYRDELNQDCISVMDPLWVPEMSHRYRFSYFRSKQFGAQKMAPPLHYSQHHCGSSKELFIHITLLYLFYLLLSHGKRSLALCGNGASSRKRTGDSQMLFHVVGSRGRHFRTVFDLFVLIILLWCSFFFLLFSFKRTYWLRNPVAWKFDNGNKEPWI